MFLKTHISLNSVFAEIDMSDDVSTLGTVSDAVVCHW